jgi:hypothetical protein
MKQRELQQNPRSNVENFCANRLAPDDEVVYSDSGVLAQGSVQVLCFLCVAVSRWAVLRI